MYKNPFTIRQCKLVRIDPYQDNYNLFVFQLPCSQTLRWRSNTPTVTEFSRMILESFGHDAKRLKEPVYGFKTSSAYYMYYHILIDDPMISILCRLKFK